MALVCIILYLCFLWNAINLLDSYISRQRRHPRSGLRGWKGIHWFESSSTKDRQAHHFYSYNNRESSAWEAPPITLNITQGKKFLIFNGFLHEQGNGNIISGLLAAHLLGLEFNRTVCVSERYEDFHDAFVPIHPDTVANCPKALEWARLNHENRKHGDGEVLRWGDYADREWTIHLINFKSPPDECQLQAQLASNVPILFLEGNTYPRWPVVPDNFFFTYYKAKPELLQMLPYDPSHPPTTVVHLRQPDAGFDTRDGLDNQTLQALGALLPANHSTYLVTNRVEWYETVADRFHWDHANWNEVFHSALGESWGSRHPSPQMLNASKSPLKKWDRRRQRHVQRTLQMWADWYTILTAQAVYHTHSEFSISAIHWQNIVPSKTILGYHATTGQLILRDESWRVDGETERLVDRRVGARGTSELRWCRGNEIQQENEGDGNRSSMLQLILISLLLILFIGFCFFVCYYLINAVE